MQNLVVSPGRLSQVSWFGQSKLDWQGIRQPSMVSLPYLILRQSPLPVFVRQTSPFPSTQAVVHWNVAAQAQDAPDQHSPALLHSE